MAPGRTHASMSMGAMMHEQHRAAAAGHAFPRLWEAKDEVRSAAHVVVVKMITTDEGEGGKFDPENVVVQAGDTVRFVTDGQAPHNVSFPADKNAGLHVPASVPFLTTANQAYDLVASAAPGTYHMQCDPHAFTGMTSTLTIRR
jgi:plastocyanin